MPASEHANPRLLDDLRSTLHEALDALGADDTRSKRAPPQREIPPDLFRECIELCDRPGRVTVEPVRMIHHAACTGGTLIVKCLAAMPNVLVLNEIDPFSPLGFDPGNPNFRPSDLLALLREGDNYVDEALLEKLFLESFRVLHHETSMEGRRLVLRDHSHSHFFTGEQVRARPTFRTFLASTYRTVSVVTVRDPVDSYLSLVESRWLHFTPATFDEYCRRYHAFLDAYADEPLVRYEDFVADPAAVARGICDELELEFATTFTDTFDSFRFSGDSGRRGAVIEARPRKVMNDAFVEEVRASEAYVSLARRLGYECIGDARGTRHP